MPVDILKRVKKDRTALARRIFDAYNKLRNTVETCEPVIRSRWIALSLPQRQALLKSVKPDTPKYHRPDIEAYFRGNTTNANIFRVPYINLEDAVKNISMLDFVVGHVMQLHRQTDAESYGKLIQYNIGHDDEQMLGYLQRAFLPLGHRLQVMKIQVFILEFSVKFCEIIQGRITDFTGAKAVQPALVPVATPQEDLLGKIATKASYRKPSIEILSRLNELIKCERDSKEDQIWAIREDAGTFFVRLMDETEHIWKTARDYNGELFLRPQKHNKADSNWAAVAGLFAKDTYMDFAYFDELVKQTGEFTVLIQAYDPADWQSTEILQEIVDAHARLSLLHRAMEQDSACNSRYY
ncbi:hypothetical protein BU23DRAFT_660388 [Bimuria novae-zelandiae CBS 107.79]|uniref:Uncharacterized protein n=1 Tax=Bimuria novae-zelandiae CBS 107.79 TaxID=1447943 RepID=A0A6A5V1R5_9PLEO|nr:hypothetical protein BU23DRAFT_660388 [Bimuria novae-zelandiae CBS 107.79]